MKTIFAAAVAAAALAANPANAAITLVTPLPFPGSNGTFTEVLPAVAGPAAGVYGVELRGGNSNAALNGTFEIATGKATSNVGAGNFNQGQFNWGCASGGAAGCGTVFNFTLGWTSAGLNFTVGSTTVNAPASPNNAPLSPTGNTLKIYAKRDVTFHISNIDGTPFNVTATGLPSGAGTPATELYFYSDDNWGGNGFTVTGTVRIHGGGNSANEILFKHGNFVPDVPEPATWAMLIGGFGLTGAAMRRRRTVAA